MGVKYRVVLIDEECAEVIDHSAHAHGAEYPVVASIGIMVPGSIPRPFWSPSIFPGHGVFLCDDKNTDTVGSC